MPTRTGGEPDDDDQDLMRRIGQGDHAAFAVLVERHLDRTIALASRQLGSRAEGEEVAQDAFTRVWTSAPRWQAGGAKVSTWLYRITVNLCIDRQRRRRSQPLDDLPEPEDERASAFDGIHDAQLSRALRGAIDRLPEAQRRAMLLCGLDGLSNGDAAEILGLSVKAVESLLVRARRTLRTTLAQTYRDATGQEAAIR